MDRTEEQLEESLVYMREQFKPLTRSIPIPPALHADLLRERLDTLVQDREVEPPQPEGKLVRFPWKPLMSVAACLVIAVGSYTVYESNKNTPQVQIMMTNEAMSSAAAADAPMPATAGVAEAVAEDAGQPVADLPMDAAMFAAPVPENMIADEAAAPDVAMFAAPTPEDAPMDGVSPKMRGALSVEEGMVTCPRGVEPIARYATLEEAKNAPLGGYLPATAPQSTQMTDAFLDAEHLVCSMSGSDPATGTVRELTVTVSTMSDEMQAYVVDPADTKRYDLRLYPMPWADSIPTDLQWITNDVVFRATDLTPALIEARIVQPAADQGDVPKASGSFSVLHEDQTLVSYRFINLNAQELMALIVLP